MSEKRVYQDKMLNSTKEIVVCNWERGDGKTHSIFKRIIRNESDKGKYIYISPFDNSLALQNHFREYVKNKERIIEKYAYSKDKITLKYKHEETIEVFCVNPNSEFRGQRNIDIAFCDEYIPNKLYIDSVLKPIGVKQIYIMLTNDNIEYIDSRNSRKVENFYDNQIEELMVEYSNVPKNEKTTITREKILQQIHILQEMKKKN